jgi:hypothetical protein
MKRQLLVLLSAFAAAGSLTFEAASIKPNTDAGAIRSWQVRPNGGVTITAYDAFS